MGIFWWSWDDCVLQMVLVILGGLGLEGGPDGPTGTSQRRRAASTSGMPPSREQRRLSGPDREKPKAPQEGVQARVADWHLVRFQRRCTPPGLRPGSGAARGDCYARLSSRPCTVSRLRRSRPGRISSRLRRCSRDRIDQFRGGCSFAGERHAQVPTMVLSAAACPYRSSARA